MKVAKFGGSSLANGDQIKKVCSIITSDPERRIIAVSAPGKRDKDDVKVTDLLIDLAQTKIEQRNVRKALDAVIKRFREIADELDIAKKTMPSIESHLSDLLSDEKIHDSPEAFMDAMKACGEDFCARMVAAYLNSIGHLAHYVDPKDAGLILSCEYGCANVLPESYNLLSKLKDSDGICIFPGFFGYTHDGQIVTFSRGGTDVTGSILAAATMADIYENWTDVDSVYAVNPALVKQPYPIAELTYNEMRELSYAGFTVLHSEALYPAFCRGIPVHIRNTNNPDAAGTRIVPVRSKFDSLVTGIAGKKGFCTINITKYMMNREIGFAKCLLEIIADEGMSVEHMPSGIDSVSVIIHSDQFTAEKERKIIERVSLELKVDRIEIRRDLSIVMIVGEAMAKTVGTTARAATALSNAGINLEIINQGSSEIALMFGVMDKYCDYAVRELYKEFFVR